MGLGQIYLNLKGREGRGIVAPGAEARAVEDEIAGRLLTLTDPKTGARIVDAVYRARDVYSGPFVGNAAELQVGLADGYRVSWQATLGGSPPGIMYPNMKKWSGDHGAFDYKQTPGTLIASRPVARGDASIMDIAPTVLRYFGVPDTFRYRWQADVLSAGWRAPAPASRARACRTLSAQPSDRGRTEAQARARAPTARAAAARGRPLAAEERTLIGDLRKLEIERQLRARGTPAG